MAFNPAEPNLLCFMDKNRVCGPDCTAFGAVPEGADYRDQQWANCMLLVNAHRTGKHLAIVATLGMEFMQRSKNEAADRARANQPPPPKVV